MKSTRTRIYALVLGIPLLLMILAACGSGTTSTGSGTPSSSGGSKTIKIGTDFPVSGADESSGKPAEDGAHLAVIQANANHTIPGYNLVFDPKDDVGLHGTHDPTVGAQNITALISDGLVVGAVGPFNSSVAEAEMPIANRAYFPMISPANTNPCLTKDTAASGCSGKNDLIPTLRPTGTVTYFRIATTDDHQGPAQADYLYKTLGLHSVYIIDDTETYGVGIADAFEKEWKALGGVDLGHSSEPGTTTSYVSLLTQIAAKHPDVIYFGGVDSTGGTLIRKQMLQIPGLQNLPFAGGDGIVTPAFANTIQPTGGGPVYGTVAVVDTSTSTAAPIQAFDAAFHQNFPNDPINVYSAAAYDCANIMIQAIKTVIANGTSTPASSSDSNGALTFRKALVSAIQNISYNGLTGTQTFDSNGDTNNRVITIYQMGLNTSGKPDWLYKTQVLVTGS